jgi:hypothetical protein
VVLLKWWAVAAAAVFIFIVARYGMLSGETSNGLAKNNVSSNGAQKINITKPGSSIVNNAIKNNSIENTRTLAATNVVVNQKSSIHILDYSSVSDIVTQRNIPTASIVRASETAQAIPSYNGSIIDVKPTIIAEITTATIELNEVNEPKETIENIETIDTEAASSNRSVMVGAFEIDKDKFRGLFRKANALFKNKENNKNEK